MSKTEAKCEKMSQKEITANYEHFKQIIDENLLNILETRPKNPVSKFAKDILKSAGMDKNGDLIEGIEQPPKRQAQKVSDDSDEDDKNKKDKKKQDSEEDEPKEEVVAESAPTDAEAPVANE